MVNVWHCAFLIIQDSPFIAPCYLLALPVQYQPAGPQQDSFSAEVEFDRDYLGRGLSLQWPPRAGVRKRYTTKRGLTLVNAMHNRRQCRYPPKAPGDGRRSGCGDQPSARCFCFAHQNLWHVGAHLSRPGGTAGPGVLTGGGESGCWSKSSRSSGNQSYPGRHGVWYTKATVADPGSSLAPHGSLALDPKQEYNG